MAPFILTHAAAGHVGILRFMFVLQMNRCGSNKESEAAEKIAPGWWYWPQAFE